MTLRCNVVLSNYQGADGKTDFSFNFILQRASDEELKAIRAHVANSPDIPLDKPEQFLYELAEIPNFAERIACFMFQSEFEDRINGIESKLNNIKSTSEVCINSLISTYHLLNFELYFDSH